MFGRFRAGLMALGISFAFAGAAAVANAQEPARRAITFKDLISMSRLSDPQISPDGRTIAYDVSTPDLDGNKMKHDIWIVSAAGGAPRQLTRSGSDMRPRWSPDGKRLAFLSARDGAQQVYTIWLEGGEASKLTSLSTGADNEIWSPDGHSIAFVSRVYPDCTDDACNSTRDADKDKNKVKAHVYDRLLYRHWTEWWDGKRSHLFIMAVEGGKPKDLTPGADYDVPPFNMGEPEALAFSPNSAELCFVANTDKDAALSTNGDLFTVPTNGAAQPARITTNPGNDWAPAYSPDGRWIAYRSQATAGYEADRWRLMLFDRKSSKHTSLDEHVDESVGQLAWTPDSQAVYFLSESKAEMPLYAMPISDAKTPTPVIASGFNAEFDVSRDGKVLAFMRTSLTMPAELFVANGDGSNMRQLTHQNGALLAQLELPAAEPFWFAGAADTQVEGLLVRPPNFDEKKKYPMLLLIHGGPQGAWEDSWGYRWNQQVMAAPGYVVVMINPRGSTGYGQKFTADISKDWGGKVYEDLMKGTDDAIAKYPFIDGTRLAAAGGSYGGYMVDWIATHTGRFKCLISHAGPYDLASEYGATEELWFAEWEFSGAPWSSPDVYKKWAPSEFAGELAKNKTPTLVIGGELDFRVPYNQDLEFFTALQRQAVPSKLVIFPDEGHWVLKPENSQFWYKTFLDWLAQYLK
jgi:dipeptidyl aminopeptidase/acylaminoacyl peptidase